jgi:hypothetical protein
MAVRAGEWTTYGFWGMLKVFPARAERQVAL